MLTPVSKFDITRRNQGASNASNIFDVAAPRGLALGAHATEPDRFTLADHSNFIGHLTRDVVAGGLSVNDRFFGRTSADPVGLEAPFTPGDPVSVEKAEEIELEGADYLWLSGSGSVSTSTTIPQKMSFLQGRLRISQSGEDVNYYLTANNLPATDGVSLRMRFERA